MTDGMWAAVWVATGFCAVFGCYLQDVWERGKASAEDAWGVHRDSADFTIAWLLFVAIWPLFLLGRACLRLIDRVESAVLSEPLHWTTKLLLGPWLLLVLCYD